MDSTATRDGVNLGQHGRVTPYLSALGAWALAFGCSVGWGSFVMPGTTFLPIAGPIGTALGICLGGAAMLVLGMNFHYLMNRYPDEGGTYTYTKECFGYDHGFLSAWFLILTYIAVLWANATALPLIARTVLGSTFQFGFHYVIAGFHVYLGEILLAIGSLVIGACVCLNRRAAANVQSAMALALLAGIVLCFTASQLHTPGGTGFEPAFAPGNSPLEGTFTIVALAPWAYVGFESITHSAAEAKFPLKRSFAIFTAAIVAGAAAYALLTLLAASAQPEGQASWATYVHDLDHYEGIASQPTFFAATTALGSFGTTVLGIASLCGIFTGVIGNYIALSRLLRRLSKDDLLPAWVGRLDANEVPRNAVLVILLISVVLPFFGRTAISWIVDVTTVGATIAYAFASASAWKLARKRGDRRMVAVGLVGLIASATFALEFLIPNLTSVKTLATESYLILALWGILGFVCFRLLLKRDEQRRLGRSIVAWVVMLGLIIFTSSVWMRQATKATLESATLDIVHGHLERESIQAATTHVTTILGATDKTMLYSILIQITLIIVALLCLFDIYRIMQRRERQMEMDKLVAEENSRAKTSFLSNMSHEIRTPMNAIIGLQSIALRDPDITVRTREHLEKIGASAQHLLGLINDILDMSRIESGRMVLKNEEFSFREFLDQINIIINGQCVDKGLHYECVIVGDVGDFYFGDDMKLKQVLINILGNSVKFTEAPGNVTLTVEQTAEFEGLCTLRFVMADTGVGMDPEYIPQIFEAFSQEDATTTNRYGGSGLGMAITKNFVDMMNGDIHVESEKGVGSTFTVTVTLRASSRSAHADRGIELPRNMRALVVDDDEVAAEHAQLVLNTIGVEADVLSNAHEAATVLREAHERGQAYGILLTDYKMPQMNGLDLVRSVREYDGGSTIVVLLTGYNWDIIEDEASAGGVDAIMAKPLFSDNLAKEIHMALLRREGVDVPSVAVHDESDHTVLAGRRVLMAEDVEQNAEILADLLDLEEIESEHAANGQKAVEMFSAAPAGYYDAILMDVRMPVMDGLSATRAIRDLDHPDARTVPIIAMTANVFDEDKERSLQAGMNAHLSKPVEPDHLYDTLAKFIASSGQ